MPGVSVAVRVEVSAYQLEEERDILFLGPGVSGTPGYAGERHARATFAIQAILKRL